MTWLCFFGICQLRTVEIVRLDMSKVLSLLRKCNVRDGLGYSQVRNANVAEQQEGGGDEGQWKLVDVRHIPNFRLPVALNKSRYLTMEL